jgi:maltose alpha-D-glucosyltransferase/alpha-amylase
MPDGDDPLFSRAVGALEREALRDYLPAQRWFADKDAALRDVRLVDAAALDAEPRESGGTRGQAHDERPYLAIFELPERERHYFIPLTLAQSAPANGDGDAPAPLVRLSDSPDGGAVYEGLATDSLALGILADVRAERRRPAARGGTFAAHATAALHDETLDEPPRVRRMNVEQSNTSVVIDERIVLKGYRKTHAGPQPELEIARFLDAVGYRNTPALLGFVEYEHPASAPMAVCIMQRFVKARGDGWSVTLDDLRRASGSQATQIERARRLGVRTAELHRAFATPGGGGGAFEPEPTTQADLDAWVAQARETATRALGTLAAELDRVPGALRADAAALLARRDEILARIAAPPLDPGVTKTRYHGDYHLGQVLVVGDDFSIVDFEGEPGRAPEVRRRKSSPLRDVAGMLRSFNYAALAGVLAAAEDAGERADGALAHAWERDAAAAFLAGYRETIAGCSSYPADPAHAAALLDLFALEKAFYEMSYELANRPAWLRIPMEGIRAILDRPTGRA